ncbi:MAG: type II toxin-antitoxin system VapC family toxin [Candidatus Cryptobacteroides sp.]
MRYLLDTNIYVYSIVDRKSLSLDVLSILEDYDNSFCMSAESVKELIIGFRNKKLLTRYWKTAKEMVSAITNEFFITVLPVDSEVMKTYSLLNINTDERHKDPSDHIIISHAINNRLPLISSDHKFLFYEKQGLEIIYNSHK